MAELRKNTDDHRYEAVVDGRVVGYVDYHVHGENVVLPHTFVEEEHRGGTIASDLVRHALDDIRDSGYLVDPRCPYVTSWLERNGEYAELIAQRDPDHELEDAESDAQHIVGLDVEDDPRI